MGTQKPRNPGTRRIVCPGLLRVTPFSPCVFPLTSVLNHHHLCQHFREVFAMSHYSSFSQPPYSQRWQNVESSPSSSGTSPLSAQFQDSFIEEAPESAYPKFMSQKESGVGKPFQAALLEIEDTFYRTFPAAAQSHGWQTGELSDEECTDQQQVSFVYPQSDGYSRMTANLEPLDSNAPDEESSTIFAHPSAFLASPTSPLAPPEGNAHSAVHSYPLTMVRPRRPSPTLHSPIQQYFQSGGMHSAEIAVPAPHRPPLSHAGSTQHEQPSVLHSPESVMNGSLSDACRPQITFRDAQNQFSSPYGTSNLCDDIPSASSLVGSSSSAGTLTSPIAHQYPLPSPISASLLCQYPNSSLAHALNVPPSPSPFSNMVYPPVSSPSPRDSSPNQAEVSYNSPDPASPGSSITLYPVPQAPANQILMPAWPLHHASPEPVPPVRELSTAARLAKRKRGKDNDKKPSLACLFCRGRKIACGPPAPGGDGKTCNQCHRRSLKCDYPAESRRGMRKEKPVVNPATGEAKVMVKSTKKRKQTPPDAT